MRRFLPIFLICIASFGADSPITKRRLPNGMMVVLAAAPADDAVAIHLTFDAGGRLGRPGTAWLASRVIASRLPGFTSDLNQERSLFAMSTTPAKLGDALELIVEALRTTTVTAAELSKVQQDGSGSTVAEETLLSLVYAGHPHAHAAKADPEGVRRRDVEQFLADHYRPAAGVLALAGSFEDETAILAKLPARGERKRCKPYDVHLSRERSRTIVSAATRQTEIHLGYPTAAAPSADWYALNILADVIGQGEESRLQRALVASGMAVDFAEGETESPCTASLLRMRVRVRAGSAVAEVREVLDRELARLTRETVTDQELATARDQERAWAAEQVSTAEGLASAAARAELFYGDAARIHTDVERMSAVSAADVLRVARRYLQPSNRGIVVVSAGH